MTVQQVAIADYSMLKFPETQDESTALGQEIVTKQLGAVNRLIAQAFQDVFHRNWSDEFLSECQRVQQGVGQDAPQVLLWKNRPFLRLLEMTEEFETRQGEQFLVIYQQYQVL